MAIDTSKLIDSLEKLAQKKNPAKDLAIYITNYAMKEHDFLFNGIKENISHYIAFIEVSDKGDLKKILEDLESLSPKAKAKHIFFDSKICRELIGFNELKNISKASNCFIYSEVKAWSDSIISLVSEYYSKRELSSILLAGNSEISKRIFKDIVDLGSKTYYYAKDKKSKLEIELLASSYKVDNLEILSKEDLSKQNYDCIISSELKETIFDSSHIDSFSKASLSIDAGIHNFSSDFIKAQFKLGSELIRLDNRAALSSYLISILETEDLVTNIIGKLSYDGISTVAGGYMGLDGEVIVDNISRPSMVIGIADGEGRVKYPPYSAEDQSKIDKVNELIARNKN